jgi:hypothetical protein
LTISHTYSLEGSCAIRLYFLLRTFLGACDFKPIKLSCDESVPSDRDRQVSDPLWSDVTGSLRVSQVANLIRAASARIYSAISCASRATVPGMMTQSHQKPPYHRLSKSALS